MTWVFEGRAPPTFPKGNLLRFGPQALRRRPGFSKILHIKVEGC